MKELPTVSDWFIYIDEDTAAADPTLTPFIGMYLVTCTTDLLNEGQIVQEPSIRRQLAMWLSMRSRAFM